MLAIKRYLARTNLQKAYRRCIHLTRPLEHDRKRFNCTMIPGDGVGPELLCAVQEIYKVMNIPIDFDVFPLSEVDPVPNVKLDDVKKSIEKNKVCIKGTFDRADQCIEKKSLTWKLRNDMDLFASVVHARSLPGIKARHKKIDIVIIRENTEGEYSALERASVHGIVECLKIITAEKSKRIAKFAFDYATRNKRKKVTAVHKANIMKLGDGLFLRSCEQIAQMYPRIKLEKMIVDNTTMQMVSKPTQFDVMVTPNLYGNIISNLAAGLVGGAGVVPGAEYSSEVAIFEPGAHHTFAKAAGKDIANPTAMLLCSVALLKHFNLYESADRLAKSINKVLTDGKVRTVDQGGKSSTQEFIDAVICNLD